MHIFLKSVSPMGYVKKLRSCGGGKPRRVMAQVLDYDIVVSTFERQSRGYVHFRTNTRGERYELPHPQLWFLRYFFFSSKRVILALNNFRSLICHKANKPNQSLVQDLNPVLRIHLLRR